MFPVDPSGGLLHISLETLLTFYPRNFIMGGLTLNSDISDVAG